MSYRAVITVQHNVSKQHVESDSVLLGYSYVSVLYIYYYSVLAVERAPLACVLRSTSGLVGVTRLSLLSLDLGEELLHRSDERLLIIVNTPGDVGPLAVLGLDVLSSFRSFSSRLCNLGRLSFAPLLYHNTVAEAETVSHQHPSTDA
jgi:hypothetical protein